jgi:hypothetical protein
MVSSVRADLCEHTAAVDNADFVKYEEIQAPNFDYTS